MLCVITLLVREILFVSSLKSIMKVFQVWSRSSYFMNVCHKKWAQPHIVMAELAPMIRKRSRPQPRIRKVSLEKEEVAEPTPENEAEAGLPYVLQPSSVPNSKYLWKPTLFFRISDLIELRKLRRARQGIDVTKLHKGDAKRRQKRAREGEEGEDDEELVKPEKGIVSAAAAAVDEDEYV